MYCAEASLIFVKIYLTLVSQWGFHIVMHFKVSKGRNYIAILKTQLLEDTVAYTVEASSK